MLTYILGLFALRLVVLGRPSLLILRLIVCSRLCLLRLLYTEIQNL